MNAMTTGAKGANALDPKDLKVILYLYQQNAHAVQVLGLPAGTPFLLSGWRARRAKRLSEFGLIKDHGNLSPPMADVLLATVTTAGIEAYNAAIATGAKTP